MKSCLPRYIKLSKEWDSEILWWHEDACLKMPPAVSLLNAQDRCPGHCFAQYPITFEAPDCKYTFFSFNCDPIWCGLLLMSLYPRD